jgi:curved DNA-binding protein CbpA
MVFEGDPLRTLGLPPGASQAEIKAAYRRLAKAFHPDTAGEAAIPRFLAIQAAYETLTGTTVRASRRPGRAEPAWRADPERARTTREGWRGRGSAGTGRARPEAGPRPDGRRAAGGSRAEGRSDAGPRPRPGRSRSGRDRAPDRATPGSTTYDAAEGEPFDPEWSGASWYGTTSGTYWTINPKEYADPRKHGPEYQARGRRRGPDGAAPEPESPDAARETASTDGPPPAAPAGFDGPWTAPEIRRPRSFRPPVPLRGTTARRVALALIGWPPLGVLVAALIGDASGCSRFAAGCDNSIGIGVWLAQLALIAVLLLIPRLAAISSIGTIVALAAAVPATLLLSVSGGAQERAASVAALTVVLGVAYVVGIIFGAVGGSRTLRA